MADLDQQQLSAMEPKSLYTIFRFNEGPIRYALCKITNVNLSHDEPNQPPRATAILQFPSLEFPPGMGFVALGSKLYCIGGQVNVNSISKKVYVVDLNTVETCYKENRSPFVQVVDMHEELIHLGDEKFCLAIVEKASRLDYDRDDNNMGFALLTFEVVKQKSSKDDQLLCWADIYDFHAVESSDDALLSRGKFFHAFVA
ncbi:Kelch repeat type 1 [Corchorus olitorius]|uniref:Kelch repeat type 1 n=1 Tax=Corchorus olitorius TaxID=93759 RepID=A0A1R3JEP4_9ROSI|nr:Kelch repeat type 1 [Corchorus olitorius]